MASVVRGAADAGDAIALDILRRAAAELITAAGAVINALEMRGDVFRAVLAGGILRSTPRLATSVAEGLAELAPRSDVHLLTAEPAVGAVRLALAEARGDAGDYRM
jgi:N-acetylglucosamine kinase-like BadF-type ATPase